MMEKKKSINSYRRELSEVKKRNSELESRLDDVKDKLVEEVEVSVCSHCGADIEDVDNLDQETKYKCKGCDAIYDTEEEAMDCCN